MSLLYTSDRSDHCPLLYLKKYIIVFQNKIDIDLYPVCLLESNFF
jgi:hypothetical protein